MSRRCVLRTDIEGYSRRTAPDQQEAQRAYDRAMGQAAAEAGLRREDWITQPAGDGELIVLPEGVYEARVVGVLAPALAARLRDYNRSRNPEHKVRLRLAVHQGLVHLDGATGFPGSAAIVVSRLLDAKPLRSVLRRLPDANMAVIVSSEIYQDVVVNHYEDVRPELFRRVRVEDRLKAFNADAWIYTPEDDVTRLPSHLVQSRPHLRLRRRVVGGLVTVALVVAVGATVTSYVHSSAGHPYPAATSATTMHPPSASGSCAGVR